jgi:hypothetical protein
MEHCADRAGACLTALLLAYRLPSLQQQLTLVVACGGRHEGYGGVCEHG